MSHALPPVALVLETNNLQAHGAPGSQIAQSLERLLVHLRDQTFGLSSLAELVITHSGLSADAQLNLAKVAGREIRFVALPSDAYYYQAKNHGFAATQAEVVVFGDSDCWPEAGWLAEIAAPFSDPETQVVSGRTTYRDDRIGTALTTIDFMYFPSPLGEGCTRNFYANNVAFRRGTFERHPYRPLAGVYRGHCQALGLELQDAGIPVHFRPRARTIHRFPDSLAELVRLRVLRGMDAVELTPLLAKAYLGRLAWTAKVPVIPAVTVMASRLGFSLASINRQDMPRLRGLALLECAALVGACSAVDFAGTMARSVSFGSRGESTSAGLSYHGDVDGLPGPLRPAA